MARVKEVWKASLNGALRGSKKTQVNSRDSITVGAKCDNGREIEVIMSLSEARELANDILRLADSTWWE